MMSEKICLILHRKSANRPEIKEAVTFLEDHGGVAFCRAVLKSNEFLFIP